MIDSKILPRPEKADRVLEVPVNSHEKPIVLLFLILIGIPLIEIYFLIEVGSEIGALRTIGLSVLTALLGTTLVRHQGFGVLMRVREASDRGDLPALEMLDAALLLVAGLFLLLPGFFTDAAGFLLLIPPLRRLLIHRYIKVAPVSASPTEHQSETRVIEGDFHRED